MMNKRSHIVLSILVLTLLFVCIGLIIVYDVSVAESLTLFGDKFFVVKQQFIRAVAGVIGLFVVSKVPTKIWVKTGPLLFLGSIFLLVAVLIPHIGSTISGAKRWIPLGPILFQPSEFTKIGLIFYLSVWLRKPRRFQSFVLILALVFGLVILEPDLGSGLVLIFIGLGMYFVSGKPIKHFLWLFITGFTGVLLLIIISPYRMQRLTTYLNPDADPQGKSYHIRQITIALGNGGLLGQGLGKSRQKYQYIPEAMTDSIFSIVAEEIGFVGCGIILIGYITLYMRCSTWVSNLSDVTEKLIGVGIVSWLAAQTLVNLSSVVALIPLTGVPLPFISYGGSSLITTLSSIGILLGLGKHENKRKI